MTYLIAIEGIDGVGKHTQSELLLARARSAGLSAALLSFPRYGDTFFGHEIRKFLTGEYGTHTDPRLAGLLFAGDRLESLPELQAELHSHEIVIVDRYVGSNLAYQAAWGPHADQSAIVDWLEHVEYEIYGMPRADVTVLLDLPVSSAARRLESRAPTMGRVTQDAYEADHAYLLRCSDAYAILAQREPGWVRVQCEEQGVSLTPQQVANGVWQHVAAGVQIPEVQSPA